MYLFSASVYFFPLDNFLAKIILRTRRANWKRSAHFQTELIVSSFSSPFMFDINIVGKEEEGAFYVEISYGRTWLFMRCVFSENFRLYDIFYVVCERK